LQRLCRCVDLLGVKLTCPAAPYQFDGVLEGCRPVKSVPKGFADQRAGRCVVPALTSMDICKQVAAFFLGSAPH
jgi:hypothetical protein